MVTSKIVLGHVVSVEGIEVDKVKIEVISKLSQQKNFSSISKPLCNLLLKDVSFEWTDDC